MSDEQTPPSSETPPQSSKAPRVDEFSVSGEQVVDFIKKILHEGNIRKIVLKNESGKTLREIPLTIGVAGALLLPVWVAIGTAAALVARMTIVIERTE